MVKGKRKQEGDVVQKVFTGKGKELLDNVAETKKPEVGPSDRSFRGRGR